MEDYFTDFKTNYRGTYTRGCWTAFRSGVYSLAQHQDIPEYLIYYDSMHDVGLDSNGVNITYYPLRCALYANATRDTTLYHDYIKDDSGDFESYSVGDCVLGRDVICELNDSTSTTCRLNVRMFAAITLAGCLIIKAVYMVTIIIRARGRVKTKCLTFGDVVFASALNTDLQIQNECLLNAGEGNRHLVSHVCHKHCTSSNPSVTGDSKSHCQQCAKFNSIDRAANLLHPCIAVQYKKSSLSNLGSTALTQMIILAVCSLSMFVCSVFLAVLFGSAIRVFKKSCSLAPDDRISGHAACSDGLQNYLTTNFGSFGGFNTSATLATLLDNKFGSEVAAFAISNGTQLLFSTLYLLLIYNITLVSIEYDWGKFEKNRQRLRCTIARGVAFEQSYVLQLPKKILFPIMAFSAAMHWLLGQAISTRQIIISNNKDPSNLWEVSIYTVCFSC